MINLSDVMPNSTDFSPTATTPIIVAIVLGLLAVAILAVGWIADQKTMTMEDWVNRVFWVGTILAVAAFITFCFGMYKEYSYRNEAITAELTQLIPEKYDIEPSTTMVSDVAGNISYSHYTSDIFVATIDGKQVEVRYEIVDHYLKITSANGSVTYPTDTEG